MRAIFIGRDFARLWGSFGLTNLGDGVMLAAGPLLVASLTDRPFLVAAAAFVQQLPWLIFGLISGVAVDRLDRKTIMVVVNLCRASVLALLAGCVFVDLASIYLVYLALFLLGVAETLADNAGLALVAQVVSPELLGTANSRLIGTMTITNQLAGPPLGALLFSVAAGLPIGVNALCLCLAAALVSRVRAESSPETAATSVSPPRCARPRRSVGADIRAGVGFLWAHPGLRTLALAILGMNVTFMAAFSVWVLYVRDLLGLSAVGFGLLTTVGAVGGLVGVVLFPRLEGRFATSTLLRVGLVTETLTHLALALGRHWVSAAVTMLVFGCHASVWGSVALSARQRATPQHLMGRVNSVYQVFSVGGAAVGALIGGVVAQTFTVVTPFWFGFVGMVVTTFVAWRQVVLVETEQLQPVDS
nr:MFS transporter [Microlunatus panaciterrae]